MHFLVSQVWNLQLALEEMNVIVFIELELIISMLNIAHAGIKKLYLFFQFRAQSLTSLKADPSQDINRGFAFRRCLNGTLFLRKCSVKALVS